MGSEETADMRPRVLIVDDSRMVRASLVKRMRERFDTREEADGEAGWRTLLADEDIQLVISDLSMPQLDGFGLLQRIRSSELERVRAVPVIMISGDEDEAARRRAMELGASDFVTKGTCTVELVARLESLLSLSRTRRELQESRQVIAQTGAIDPATGLYTRVYLDKLGEQALAHARRHNGEVSALMIGLDNFESLTAEYGEAVTKALVAQFAKMLHGSVRKEDSLTQVGPAEFAILALFIGGAGATSFAQRMKDGVNRAAINYRGRPIRLTISVGLANSVADSAGSIEHLLAKAEERMRSGRSGGGNRIVGFGGKPVADAPPSVDRALAALRAGNPQAVRANLDRLAVSLMPLLRLLDCEYRIGMDLEALESALKSRVTP